MFRAVRASSAPERINEVMAKHTVIVQFKNENDSVDIDWFYDLHEVLHELLKRNKFGRVDGSDFGNGTINLYILTNSLRRTLDLILMNLTLYKLEGNAVIVRRRGDDHYIVLWPPDFAEEFSEM